MVTYGKNCTSRKGSLEHIGHITVYVHICAIYRIKYTYCCLGYIEYFHDKFRGMELYCKIRLELDAAHNSLSIWNYLNRPHCVPYCVHYSLSSIWNSTNQLSDSKRNTSFFVSTLYTYKTENYCWTTLSKPFFWKYM